ncbi:hypothetical protein EJB05_30392, partial [Eragrostis curvula]
MRRSNPTHDVSSRCAGSTTQISSLAADVLGEIFLRLPSPASVARASCACVHWRGVASSAAFLRRFHGCAPLVKYVSCCSLTHPASRSLSDDPDIAAFLRRAKFHQEPCDLVLDCRHGLLLISPSEQTGNHAKEVLVVYEPVSDLRVNIGSRPDDGHPCSYFTDCLLLDGHDGSVASVQEDGQRIRAVVYDLSSNQWTFHPWVEGISAPEATTDQNSVVIKPSPMHAARCVYWKYRAHDSLLSLDMATMEFSIVPLPHRVRAKTPYAVGEMRNAECCLVSCSAHSIADAGQKMQVWRRVVSGNDVEHWELQRQVPLMELVQAIPARLRVYNIRAVAAGNVLVWFKVEGHSQSVNDHAAFCLDSFKMLEQFVSHELILYPYQMTWPPLLATGCAVADAPGKCCVYSCVLSFHTAKHMV